MTSEKSENKSSEPSSIDIKIPQTPFKPVQPKVHYMQYLLSFILQPKVLLVFFILFVILILEVVVSQLPKPQPPMPVNPVSIPTNSVTTTPTINPLFTPTLAANPTYLPSNWTTYYSGSEVKSFAFSFTIPFGWRVMYRADPDVLNPGPNYISKIDFDCLPPGATPIPDAQDWMGWGEMTVTVYKGSDTPEDWIQKTFPPERDKLAAYPDGTIGNMPAYLVAQKKNLSSSDIIFSYFMNRDIVVTNNYIYEFGFSQNGSGDFIQTIKRGIWPFLKFE